MKPKVPFIVAAPRAGVFVLNVPGSDPIKIKGAQRHRTGVRYAKLEDDILMELYKAIGDYKRKGDIP